MTRKRTIGLGVLAILVTTVCIGAVSYKRTFPYGESHCCIDAMSSALEIYAINNFGHYPAGQSSPEASLSLLYRSNLIDAGTLRGMIVPEKKVRMILESGGLLDSNSCGWHYTPGLTQADNFDLALLWCKAALGHNGQRNKSNGRQVVFVSGDIRWISGDEWNDFIQKQNQLLKQRTLREINGLPLVTGMVELPDGSRTNDVQDAWRIEDQKQSQDSEGTSSTSGSSGLGEQLVMYQAPFQNGTLTRKLSFSKLVSDPVTLVFSNGMPKSSNYVFNMH